MSPGDGDPVAALSGRPLIASSNRTRGWCLRCQRKNGIRAAVGAADRSRDPRFEDGDRVVLLVAAAPDSSPSMPRERRWRVVVASHADHPRRPRSAVTTPGTVQARMTGTLRAEGWRYALDDAGDRWEEAPDALVLRDVSLCWVSGVGDDDADGGGRPDPPTGEEPSEQFERRPPSAARPDWPEGEEEWRRRLVRDRFHGECSH